MGQLNSTHHSKPLDLSGYSPLATLQSEVAFFIGSKNPIHPPSLFILSDKIIFECPTNVPKTSASNAIAVNDQGDVLINTLEGYLYFIAKDGSSRKIPNYHKKLNNGGYTYEESEIMDKNGKWVTAIAFLNPNIQQNFASVWLKISKIAGVNDADEIIAQGETIYGEQHAIFLTPLKSK